MNKNKLPVLPAREKIEGENRVFRCGAQSCSERLATLKQGEDWASLLLCKGYDFSGKEGVFAKDLHKPRRQSQGVAVRELCDGGWEGIDLLPRERRDELLDRLPSRVDFGIAFDDEERPTVLIGQCARCGRRSKIRCEN